MIEYHGNYLSIRKLRSWITSEWGREIVKRLTGESKIAYTITIRSSISTNARLSL